MSVNDPMMESKHHDPMLDGIQRYEPYEKFGCGGHSEGDFVLFSDLPALIEKVREDERGKALGVGRWVDGADGVARWHHAGSTTQTSAPEAASLLSAAPVPPTSVAPAGEDYGAHRWMAVADPAAYEQGQRDEREACIAAVSAPTLHDDACCSNGCTLMHSSEWEATRRIQIALGFPLSEEPPPPYRCDGSCNCTAAAFIAAIRAREEKP